MEIGGGKVIILTGPKAGKRVDVPPGRKLQEKTVTDADAKRILENMEGKTDRWEKFLRRKWKDSEQKGNFPEAKEEDTRSTLNRYTFGLIGSGGESKTDTAASAASSAPSASSASSGGESKSNKPAAAAPAETRGDKRARLQAFGKNSGEPFGLNGNSKNDDIEVALKVIAAVGDSDAKRFYKLYKNDRTMLGVIETSSQDVYNAKTTDGGKMNSILKGTYIVCLDDKTDGWCKTVIIDPRSEKGLENKDVVKADGIYYIQKKGLGNFYTYVKHDVDLVDAAEVLKKTNGKRSGLGLWEEAIKKTPKESAAPEESAAASEESAAAEWTPEVRDLVRKPTTAKGQTGPGRNVYEITAIKNNKATLRKVGTEKNNATKVALDKLTLEKKKDTEAEAQGVLGGALAAAGGLLGGAVDLGAKAVRKTAGVAAGAVSSLTSDTGAAGDAAEAPAKKKKAKTKKAPAQKRVPEKKATGQKFELEQHVGKYNVKRKKGKRVEGTRNYTVESYDPETKTYDLRVWNKDTNEPTKQIAKGIKESDITDKNWLQEGVHFETDAFLHYEHFEEGIEGMHEGMSEGMIDE